MRLSKVIQRNKDKEAQSDGFMFVNGPESSEKCKSFEPSRLAVKSIII
jgi:hypothetical protein